jgi:hypothetical protein
LSRLKNIPLLSPFQSFIDGPSTNLIKILALGKENKSMKEDPHGFSQKNSNIKSTYRYKIV